MPLIIVLCSIALIIALLLSSRIALRIKYADGLKVYLKILFITLQLYPIKERKKRYRHSMSKRKAEKIKKSLQKKPKKEKKKKSKKDKKKKEGDKEEAQISKDDVLSIISIVLTFVKSFVARFTHSVRLKASRLKIVVASEDAATTAITYGAVTQAINVLFPLLDKIKTVKKLPRGKELSVRADFTTDTPSIEIDVEIYVRFAKAIRIVLGAIIKAFIKAVKDRMKMLERKKR